MEGQASLLWGVLAADKWLDLVPLELVTMRQVGLPRESSDRVVWRFAQEHGMLLLTNNRNATGVDSLTATILEEASLSSLPVLTVGDLDRLGEPRYRRRCAARLLEIVLDLENYLGTGRIFIP
jgi:hypothetical protein